MLKDIKGLCKQEECPLYGALPISGEIVLGEDCYELLFDCDEEGKWTAIDPTDPESKRLITSKLVIVGIAPAREELRQKRPFVGPSGYLLRSVLAQKGLKEYYLTNTTLCEVPDTIDQAERSTAEHCCKDRLLAEIKALNPDLVMVMGNIPLNNLSDRKLGIKAVEGRILPGAHDLVILGASHPAAILRRPDDYNDFVDAIDAGARYLGGTYQQAELPQSIIVTEENKGEILQKLFNADEIVIDLETTKKGLFPYDRDPDGIRCISIAIDSSTGYIFPSEYTDNSDLKRLVKEKKGIYHHGQFDTSFLMVAGYEPKIYYDTLLAHYMMDERPFAHGLKELARKYLGAPDWESAIKEYLPHKNSSYDLIPDDVLYKYAGYDVAFTHQLYERFKTEVNGGVYHNLIIPCANMFTELRHRGIKIDLDTLLTLDDELETELTESLNELHEICGYALNPLSPKEVSEFVYGTLKIPDIYKGSTSKDILEDYRQTYPAIDKILECREFGKLKSTYVVSVANFLDAQYRIHPTTKIFGTVTGRISTEDPSIMNIPRGSKIKRMFIPEEGYHILELDQKQMELRTYCLLSEDTYLTKYLLEGGDPHRLVASQAYGEEKADKERVHAKNAVFGRLYGGGTAAISRSTGLSPRETDKLIATVDTLFPGIAAFSEDLIKKVHQDGFLESYFGRKRRFGLLTNETKHRIYKQATNFPIQSAASDLNLYCMLHVFAERKRFGVVPMFPVHDSIVFDVEDTSVIPSLIKEIEDFCNTLVGGKVRFGVDAKVGPNWGDTKKL